MGQGATFRGRGNTTQHWFCLVQYIDSLFFSMDDVVFFKLNQLMYLNSSFILLDKTKYYTFVIFDTFPKWLLMVNMVSCFLT